MDVSTPLPFELLRRNAADDPDGVFSRTAAHTTTNAAALVAATQTACELRRIGIRPGDIVSLDLPDQLSLLFSLALFHEGAIGTHLPVGYPLAHALPVAWTLTTRPDGARAGTVVEIDAAFLRRSEENPSDNTPQESPTDVMRIAFSSGTTGTSRAIPIDGSTYTYLMRAVGTWFADGPILNLMGVATAGGFGEFILSMAAGHTYLSPGASDPAELLGLIDAAGVTTLKGSPAQVASLVDEARRQGRTLENIASVAISGGTLPPTAAERILETTNGCAISVAYGSTEAGAATRGAYSLEHPTAAGRLLPGTALEIVGDDDQPLPVGRAGRIRYRTLAMMRGYLADPAATALALRDGWFYPGDRGILSDDGILTVLGREGEQINTGGTKLDPVQLDHAALRFPGVRDACGFATPTTSGIDRIGLAVVTDDDVDRQALIAHLRTDLGPAAPTLLARVDEIPRNAAGKPLRGELSRRYAEI